MRTGQSIRASPNMWTGRPASRQRPRPAIHAGPAATCRSLPPFLNRFSKRSIKTGSRTFLMMTGSLQSWSSPEVTSAIYWITSAENNGTVSYALHLSECTRGDAFRLSERVSKIVSVPESAPVRDFCDGTGGMKKKPRRLPDSDVRQILFISKPVTALNFREK